MTNNTDNWVHRSTDMKCGTCMFYENLRCKRHAPTLQGFPAVYSDDWCGDHKIDKETMKQLYEVRTVGVV